MTLEKLIMYAEIGIKTNLERNSQMLDVDPSLKSFMNPVNTTIQKDYDTLKNMQNMIELGKQTQEILDYLE